MQPGLQRAVLAVHRHRAEVGGRDSGVVVPYDAGVERVGDTEREVVGALAQGGTQVVGVQQPAGVVQVGSDPAVERVDRDVAGGEDAAQADLGGAGRHAVDGPQLGRDLREQRAQQGGHRGVRVDECHHGVAAVGTQPSGLVDAGCAPGRGR